MNQLFLTFTCFLVLSLSAKETPRILLKGSSYQMGLQMAAKYKTKTSGLCMQFNGMASLYLKISKKKLHEKALKIAKHMAKDDLDEIKGMAKGTKIPYEDMLVYNLFYSLASSPFACRQFATWDKRTTTGDLIHARNLDWFDYPGSPMKKNNLIINYHGTTVDAKATQNSSQITKKHQPYLILSWPGYAAALTGTNKAGLTLGYNQLRLKGDTQHISEPTFFTIKRILRTCSTLEEAVAVFKKTLPMDSGSVLISDAKQKKAAVVEIVRGKVGVRYAPTNMISNANHPTKEAGIEGLKSSQTASAEHPVCTAAKRINGKFNAKSVQKLMAGPTVLQPRLNLLCVVFIPEKNRMWLSCGRESAANGPFVEFKLFKIEK